MRFVKKILMKPRIVEFFGKDSDSNNGSIKKALEISVNNLRIQTFLVSNKLSKTGLILPIPNFYR